MTAGVSFPSIARGVVWSSGYAADADFPLANLANLEEPRRVCRAAAAGAFYVSGRFGSDREIDFISIAHHNLPAGSTIRVVVYTDIDNGAAPYAADTGHIPVWPVGSADAGYLNVRPLRLPVPVVGNGIYIDFGNTGPEPVEIGAIEIGRFWEWSDVAVPRSLGVDSRSIVAGVSRGSSHVMRQWSPRIVAGSREVVLQTELDTTVMDFQHQNGLSRSFVWCEDVDDPSTWARQCMLVTNETLPTAAAVDYEVGRMNFSLVEHLR